jgi:5,5'-dehydrodivanillate O-demethylase
LAVGSGGGRLWKMHVYQMRIPMDDTTTMHLWYSAYEPPPGVDVPRKLLDRIPLYDVPFLDERGEYILDCVDSQDIMAWITQGPIAARELEKLGSTDRGVTLFRKMLQRELKRVEAGEDPMGVVRDPAKNTVISFPLERDKAHFTDGFASLIRRQQARYSPFLDDLIAVFAAYNEQRLGEQLPPLPTGDVAVAP